MSAVTAIRAQRAINARRAERLGAALTTVMAADFVTGAAADFARVCSAKGEVVELVRRGEGESRIDFAARAKSLAAALGAPRLVFGGIDPDFDPEAVPEAPEAPQRGAHRPDWTAAHGCTPARRGRCGPSSTANGQ